MFVICTKMFILLKVKPTTLMLSDVGESTGDLPAANNASDTYPVQHAVMPKQDSENLGLVIIQNDGGECIRSGPVYSVNKTDFNMPSKAKFGEDCDEILKSKCREKAIMDNEYPARESVCELPAGSDQTTSKEQCLHEKQSSRVYSKSDDYSGGSPGTPLLDEQPYSPSLSSGAIDRVPTLKISPASTPLKLEDGTNSETKTESESERQKNLSFMLKAPSESCAVVVQPFNKNSKIKTEPFETSKTNVSSYSKDNDMLSSTLNKKTKTDIKMEPDVPHAFESNMMQMYSSIRALKEAGRGRENLVTGAVYEKGDKHSKDVVKIRESGISSSDVKDDRKDVKVESVNSSKNVKSDNVNSSSSSNSSCCSNSNHSTKDRRHSVSLSRKHHHSTGSKSEVHLNSKSHDRKHETSSKGSDKSRSRNDSTSDRRNCSKCYRRSKVRRASIGVQCRRDKTFGKYLTPLVPNKTQTKHTALPRPVPLSQTGPECLKYNRFIRIETYPNGGASVVHMYQDEIQSLSATELEELVTEYFKVSVKC